MDRARPAAERFWRRRYGPPIVILLLVSPVFLRDVLPELLMWVHAGVAWSLMTGWLCYKVVETLRGPPAEPEPRAT